MKKIITIITLIILFNSNIKAQESGVSDKFLHFYAGFFVSGIVGLTLIDTQIKPINKVGIVLGSAFTIGLAKELFDTQKGGSGFNAQDLAFTVLGAVPITLTIKLNKNKKHKDENKRRY